MEDNLETDFQLKFSKDPQPLFSILKKRFFSIFLSLFCINQLVQAHQSSFSVVSLSGVFIPSMIDSLIPGIEIRKRVS